MPRGRPTERLIVRIRLVRLLSVSAAASAVTWATASASAEFSTDAGGSTDADEGACAVTPAVEMPVLAATSSRNDVIDAVTVEGGAAASAAVTADVTESAFS